MTETHEQKLPANLADSNVNKLFKLGNVMSRDASGTLYSAGKQLDGRNVAVNLLESGYSIVSKKLIRIEHPNICKVLKVLKLKDGALAIIIDKPKGRPILESIRGGEAGILFTLNQAISAILQLLSALHAIHNTRYTARNLSVNNLYLFQDENGNLRLTLVSCGISGSSISSEAPHYFAPERIMNADKGDKRADIWAAGAIFYHLLFRRPPFEGDDANEVARKNMLEEPDYKSESAEIPDELIDILKRAMHKDETKRYQTAAEMVGDLLPLRERYNEPMSEDVSNALRKSYPPPRPADKRDQKKQRGLATAIRKIVASRDRARKDSTMEYGTKSETEVAEKSADKKEASKKGMPGKKDLAKRRTLLGIPAVSTEPIPKGAVVVDTPIRGLSKVLSGTKGRPAPSDGLFSPRSILGDDEDIKKLESEMGFLEAPEDSEVPTRVVNPEAFSEFVDKINELAELDEEKSARREEGGDEPAAREDPRERETVRPPATASPKERKESAESKRGPTSASESLSKPQRLAKSEPEPAKKEKSKPSFKLSPRGKGKSRVGSKFKLSSENKPPMVSGIKNAPQKSAPADAPATNLRGTLIAGSMVMARPDLGNVALAEEKSDEKSPRDPVSDAVPAPAPVDPRESSGSSVMELSEADISVQREISGEAFAPALGNQGSPESGAAAPLAGMKRGQWIKWLGVGSVAGMAIGLVGLLLTRGSDPEEEALQRVSAESIQSGPAIAKRDVEKTAEKVEPAPSKSAEPSVESEPLHEKQPAKPPLEEVSISFMGMPKGSTVKKNGEKTDVPIKTIKSNDPITVSISADGYLPFEKKIIPDSDKEVTVQLQKRPEKIIKKKVFGKKKTKPKKTKLKKTKPSGKKLVSNPF